MCGICGYWANTNQVGKRQIGFQMAEAISSRGPDSVGCTVISDGGPVFAHRRLSVIDTTSAGLQPMLSDSGRFTVVYNGEIYNHLELRAALEAERVAPEWRGHSDTETLLACFEAWGRDKTLAKMNGMFAFALWDTQTCVLTLVRDRLGEKPLYYGMAQGIFMFASELKALHNHPSFRGTVNRAALTGLIQYSYVPGPHSIYSEVHKLQPGHLLEVSLDASGTFPAKLKSRAYWHLNDKIKSGLDAPFIGSPKDAVSATRDLLTEVVASQMIADVPIGAFLSGGIDSSLVASIMQELTPGSVRTFSIGFEDKEFDESKSARAVANHIGTDHIELIVTPETLMDVIPHLSKIYCEPFADSSQLPTYLVSQLAREHVTVALTGDGADEIFGGYNRYMAAGKIWNRASHIPRPLRSAASNAILSIPKVFWNGLFNRLAPILPARAGVRLPGEKLHKFARLLQLETRSDYFESLVSLTQDPESIVIDGSIPKTAITDSAAWPETDSFEHWMMGLDALTYLPDDICVKVDRASMANSLETRAPYLDRRVIEFAWSLPLNLKIREGNSKWILREILSGYVPRDLFERPKMGFGVPLGKWLRAPLRSWAENLLSEDRLRAGGYFNIENTRSLWLAHLAGQGSHEYVLWNILMFQAWQERWDH